MCRPLLRGELVLADDAHVVHLATEGDRAWVYAPWTSVRVVRVATLRCLRLRVVLGSSYWEVN